MGYTINLNEGFPEMSWDQDDTIKTDVVFSLFVTKGSFFADLDFGSRLHLVRTTSDQNVALAGDFCKEALQWLLDTGKAQSIDIETERDDNVPNRINIALEIVQANGTKVTFELFKEVV